MIAKVDDTIERIRYNDYGATKDIPSGHGYNGEMMDDTGLVYLRARYYEPDTGRFIQVDNNYERESESVVSQNRYVYTLNNPYKYVDRNGNFAITIGTLIGIFVVGAVTATTLVEVEKNTHVISNTLIGIGEGIGTIGKNAIDVLCPLNPLFPKPRVKCPESSLPHTNLDFTSLLKDLQGLINSLGMTAVAKYILSNVDTTRKYKYNKATHHIVPKSKKHSNGPDRSLDIARAELRSSLIKVETDYRNLVEIHTNVHVRMHTNAYFCFIENQFYPGVTKDITPAGVSARLLAIKTALKQLDSQINAAI